MKRKMYKIVAVISLLTLLIPFMNGCTNTSVMNETKEFTDTEKFRDGKSRIGFFLPQGYLLKNVTDGVDIGGFVFDDTFDDFRPLWDSDIIACRKHNYRLVYQYIEESNCN